MTHSTPHRARRAPGTGYSGAGAYYVLFLLFTVLTFSLIDRYILSILLQPIKEELDVSDTGMGFLASAFALFNAVAGIPLARLADRRSRRAIISAGLAAWSVLTALQGAARSFTTLALLRVGVGVGEATTGPAAHSLISDYFPPERRATAISIYTMGGHVGVLIGFQLGGWLNDSYGWRTAMVVVGLPGLLAALVFRLTVREPARGAIEGRRDEGPRESIRDVARFLWSRRSFRHLTSAAPLFVVPFYAINIWGPAFMIRVHGMSTTEVGLWFGPIVGLGGAAGTLVGGHVCDRLGIRDERWYLRLPAFCALAMVPFVVGFLMSPDPMWSLASLAPMVFLGAFFLGPMYALAQGLARLRMRAMSSALVHLMISVIAAGVGPQVVGILNDLMEPRLGDEAVRYSLLIIVAANLWAAVHAFAAMRTLREDLAAAQE